MSGEGGSVSTAPRKVGVAQPEWANVAREWRIAPLRCLELGLRLRGTRPSSKARPLAEDASEAITAEILAAAVCHATNWDRLRDAFSRHASTPGVFDAEALSSLSLDAFEDLFADAFKSRPPGDLRGRYQTFVETADYLNRCVPFDVKHLASSPVAVGGPGGLYDRLRLVPAFARDPEEKKARVLVQELCRTRLVSILDIDHVRPAIEYHLIRLYLRTQRVLPRAAEDEVRLQNDASFHAPTVMSIRRAVEEAMYFTASAAAAPIFEINQIEWQIARSFCERDGPRCLGPARPDKPLGESVESICKGDACPFVEICGGARDPRLAALREPQLAAKYDFY